MARTDPNVQRLKKMGIRRRDELPLAPVKTIAATRHSGAAREHTQLGDLRYGREHTAVNLEGEDSAGIEIELR